MNQVMDHLPSIIAIHYDICIYGHTPEKHDWHLLKLMQTAAQHGVVFNSSKCWIRQPQIGFYSVMFTTKDMWLDPPRSKPYKTSPLLNSLLNSSHFLGLNTLG